MLEEDGARTYMPPPEDLLPEDEAGNGMNTEAVTDVVALEQQQAAEDAALAQLTLDEQLDVLEDAVTRQSLHREILYRTLGFCLQRHELREVEEMIAACPEFAKATLSQYHLVQVLVKARGLTELMMDEEGNVVTTEQLDGLTEDEADDLVAFYAYETTEAGRAFYRQHDPLKRLTELFANEPNRAETYRELLALCSEETPSYNDINTLLAHRDVLYMDVPDGARKIQPSVFLDRLERAGGLVYEKGSGWKTTEKGREFVTRDNS